MYQSPYSTLLAAMKQKAIYKKKNNVWAMREKSNKICLKYSPLPFSQLKFDCKVT